MPSLVRLHKKFASDELDFIGVYGGGPGGETPEAASEHLKRRKIAIPALHDPKNAIAKAFGIPNVRPQAVLIDKAGLVIWRGDPRSELGKVLAPPEPKIEPVKIESLAEAKALPNGTTAVSTTFASFLWEGDQFQKAMRVLARNPQITHLSLKVKNTHWEKGNPLGVLREFKSLKSLSVDDNREGAGVNFYENFAAMKALEKIEFEFF